MWIGFSAKISISRLETILKSLYPERRIHWGELNLNYDICIDRQCNPSEFPFLLDFTFFYQVDEYWEAMKLANKLSTSFQCKTIVDSTRHGPTDAPFWCIVWNKGKAYLADDANSIFMEFDVELPVEEQELGPVSIVKPIDDVFASKYKERRNNEKIF